MHRRNCRFITRLGVIIWTGGVWACQTPSIPVAPPQLPRQPLPPPTRNWENVAILESTGQPLPGGYTVGQDNGKRDRIGVYLKTLDGAQSRREHWQYNPFNRSWRLLEKDLPLRFYPVQFTLYDILGRAEFYSGLGYYFQPLLAEPIVYLVDFVGTPKRGRLPNIVGLKQPTRFFVVGESAFLIEAGGQNNLREYDDDNPSGGWKLRTKLPLTGQTELHAFAIDAKVGYVLVEGPTVRLYQFDPPNNRWIRRADFPGAGRTRGVVSPLNGRAYYGTGQATAQAGGLRDLWEYTPATDTWRRVAEYPGRGQVDLVAHELDDRLYIGLGYSVEPTRIQTNAYEAQYDLWWFSP